MASVTSLTLQLTSAPSLNNLLLAGLGSSNSTNTLGISDDDSNTWVIGASDTNNGATNTKLGDWSAVVTSLSPNANPTVTYTATGTAARMAIILEEYSGNATSAVKRDSGINSSSVAVTSLTVSTTGSSTLSGDLAWAVFNDGIQTFTAGSGYAQGQIDAAAPNTRVFSEFQSLGSGGTITATATMSTAANYNGNLATYKPSGGAGAAVVSLYTRTLMGAGI